MYYTQCTIHEFVESETFDKNNTIRLLKLNYAALCD